MTPGLSKDIQYHVWPYFCKLAIHQIRHQVTHKVGCQPGDSIWLLWSSSGVCVGMYGVNITPEGRGRSDGYNTEIIERKQLNLLDTAGRHEGNSSACYRLSLTVSWGVPTACQPAPNGWSWSVTHHCRRWWLLSHAVLSSLYCCHSLSTVIEDHWLALESCFSLPLDICILMNDFSLCLAFR